MSSKVPTLSAFFPAYNDAESLPSLIEKTFAVLTRHAEQFEVIVVNDGSQDATKGVLRQLCARFGPGLRVVEHPQNRGYGAALRSGFQAAIYDLVFYTDGDNQYDVDELPLLLERLEPEVGLVNGYKLRRQDPWHRIWIGAIYNRLARLVFGIRLRDIDCDFRLIRRGLLQQLHLESNTGAICIELVRKAELTQWEVAEVGVHHFPRQYGRSQFFRMRSLLRTLRQLVALYVTLAPRQPAWPRHRKACERVVS